jgi:hypothetical protein
MIGGVKELLRIAPASSLAGSYSSRGEQKLGKTASDTSCYQMMRGIYRSWLSCIVSKSCLLSLQAQFSRYLSFPSFPRRQVRAIFWGSKCPSCQFWPATRVSSKRKCAISYLARFNCRDMMPGSLATFLEWQSRPFFRTITSHRRSFQIHSITYTCPEDEYCLLTTGNC